MPVTDMQDRGQYLSLALFAQAIVSVLMEYVDENKSKKLRSSLSEALEALQKTAAAAGRPRSPGVPFSSYEHLSTLHEAWKPGDRANAIRKIKQILAAPRDEKSKAFADELIPLFSKLQIQALWNFEQPRPVSPKVMQRVCRLA
jgi:hypothetical protein